MTQERAATSAMRRKRRRHPSLLRTQDGVEEIVPGLSTWTAEDLVEAGAWDDDLADVASTYSDRFELDEASVSSIYED